MSWKFVLSLLFALIVAIFAIQNAEPVGVTFLFKKAEISQALVILISAALGALIVALLGLISQMKLKAAIRENKRVIGQLEKQATISSAVRTESEETVDTAKDEEEKKTGQSTV